MTKFTDIFIHREFLTFFHTDRGEAKFNLNTGEMWEKKPKQKKYIQVGSLVFYFRGYDYYSLTSILKSFLVKDETDYSTLIYNLIENIWHRIIVVKEWQTSGYRARGLKSLSNVLFELYSEHRNMVEWAKYGIIVRGNAFVPPTRFPKDVRKILKKYRVTINQKYIKSKHFGLFKIFDEETELVIKFIRECEKNNLFEMYPIKEKFFENETYLPLIIGLVVNNNYTFTRIIQYIFDYIIPYENMSLFECLNSLRDYASMSLQINMNDYEKYPKYLKSKHDIIAKNYNDFKIKYDEKMFVKNIDTSLEYSGEKYCVIAPKSSQELRLEAKELRHCVDSYIRRIVEGKCMIFFLRQKNSKDISNVTLEIRNNTLLQAKGKSNRPIDESEESFLKKYCQKRKIQFMVN